jgi:hypothetical protein
MKKIDKKESHSLLDTLSKSKIKHKLYEITKLIFINIALKRSNGSGRKAIKMNHKKIESLINSFDRKKGVSQKNAIPIEILIS